MNKTDKLKPQKYFSAEEVSLFEKIPHVIKSEESLNILSFINNQNLYHIHIVEIVDRADYFNPKVFEYFETPPGELENEQGKVYIKKGKYLSANFNSEILTLIQELKPYDYDNSKKMLDKLNSEYCDSFFAQTNQDKLLTQTKSVIEYSKKKWNVPKIQFSPERLKELGEINDWKALTKELKSDIANQNLKFPKTESFNDYDYAPVFFEDVLYIEDYSGDRIFVCKEEGDLLTWYLAERNYKNNPFPGNVSEFLQDYQQEQQYYEYDEFDIAAQFKNGELVQSNMGMETVSLILGCIYDDLLERKKIKEISYNLSFEELLNNYTYQKEPYKMKNLALFNIFKSLINVDGKLTYKDFSYINPNILNKEIQNKPLKDDLRIIEKMSSKLKLTTSLTKNQIQDIKNYLNKFMEQNNHSVESQKVTNQILNLISPKKINKP